MAALTNEDVNRLISGSIAPGSLGLSTSHNPNAGAFNQYERLGYEGALPAYVALNRQVAAEEDPAEVRRLRDEAKQYLHQGIGTLEDVGKVNGLNSAQYQSLAALVGGNPMEGVAGWATPHSMLQQQLLGQAQAANTQNEYQKQKATAMLQYGVPEAINMTSQDMANYNMPGVINAMSSPDAASTIQRRAVENQLGTAEQALRARQVAYQTGMPQTPENLKTTLPNGQSIDAAVGGVGLAPDAYRGPQSQEQGAANTQKALQTFEDFRKFGAENTPEVVQQRLNAVDNVMTNLKEQSSILPGGKVSLSPDAAAGLKDVAPNLITEGLVQDLYKKGGIDTPVANTMTSLVQLRNVPGMEGIADNALAALAAGKQVNMDDIRGQIEGGKNAYTQKSNLNPVVSKRAAALLKEGNLDRAPIEEINQQAINAGYNKSFGTKPSAQKNTDAALQATLQGIKIPEDLQKTMGMSQGYAADAIRAGLKSSPKAAKQMKDNLTKYFVQRALQNKQSPANAKVEAQEFIDHFKDDNLGGMY